MAPAAERSLFPALHQRYVAVAVGGLDRLGTHWHCCPTASEPWAPTARQGLLCSVSLGKIYVEKMSTSFRVTGVTGEQEWVQTCLAELNSCARGFVLISRQPFPAREGIFPLLTTFIFYLLDPGNSFFFFTLFFFKEKLQLICFNLQLRSAQQFHVMLR